MSALKSKARAFDKSVRRRNRSEWLAAAFTVVVFSGAGVLYLIRGAHPLIPIGYAVIVVAALFVSWFLHRRGRTNGLDDSVNLDAAVFVALYRSELVAQRKLLHGAWAWYVLPLFAGLAISDLGHALAKGSTVAQWLVTPGYIHGCVVLFLGIAWVNRVAARGLNRKVEALDRDAGPTATVG